MEKKKYEFKAFDSNGKEIELCSGKFIYELTDEQVGWAQLGIMIGLQSRYKDPHVTFREI